jgi:chemotaxis protein CheD
LEEGIKNIINVSFGTVAIHKKPAILYTVVGSSVVISLYDRFKGVGGLIYPLLPKPKTKKEAEKIPQKYATSGIFYAIEKMMEFGIDNTAQIEAKLVGGAKFNFLEDTFYPSMSIDEIINSHIEEVENLLEKLKIRIVAKHTGGNFGRAIEFNLNDGTIKVKIMGEEKVII